MTLNDLKRYKEKNTESLQTYKDQQEQMIKQFKFQIDTNDNNVKEFSKKTLNKFETMLKQDIQEFNDKINDVKIENGKYNLELSKKNKEMSEKIEVIEKVKESLSQFWEEELEKIKAFHFTNFELSFKEIHELDEKIKLVANAIDVSFLVYINRIINQ